jgi:hypothetical protein
VARSTIWSTSANARPLAATSRCALATCRAAQSIRFFAPHHGLGRWRGLRHGEIVGSCWTWRPIARWRYPGTSGSAWVTGTEQRSADAGPAEGERR